MTAPAKLDKEQILALAKTGWKVQQIAGFFRVAVSTIYQYVNGEEMQQAREAGLGEIWTHYYKRALESDKVLLHFVESQLGQVPVPRRALADVPDEEIAREVQTRKAVKQLLRQEAKQIPEARVVETTTANVPKKGNGDESGS